jgi:hypothetical protein
MRNRKGAKAVIDDGMPFGKFTDIAIQIFRRKTVLPGAQIAPKALLLHPCRMGGERKDSLDLRGKQHSPLLLAIIEWTATVPTARKDQIAP